MLRFLLKSRVEFYKCYPKLKIIVRDENYIKLIEKFNLHKEMGISNILFSETQYNHKCSQVYRFQLLINELASFEIDEVPVGLARCLLLK